MSLIRLWRGWLINQPAPDDLAQADRLLDESTPAINFRDVFVGLKINILSGQLLAEYSHHLGCNAAPPMTRPRPDVNEVGVAHSIGEHAGGADELFASVRDACRMTILER